MIIGVMADIHLGNHTAFSGVEVGRINNRCQQILDCLEAGLLKAVQLGCDVVILAGDIFDSDHPFPDLIARVLELFRRFKAMGLVIIPVVGNHDQHSNTPSDHALAPLMGEFEVFEKPGYIERVPRVFICPFGYNPVDFSDGGDITIAHHGISEDTTHPAKAAGSGVIRVEKIREWMATVKCSVYLSGDWHEHRAWDNNRIIQVGALAPVNWTNRAYIPLHHDPYGSLIVIKGGGVERYIIPGPRFMKAVSETEVSLLVTDTQLDGNIPYVDFIGGDLAVVPSELKPFLRTSGAVEDDARAATRRVREEVSNSSAEEQTHGLLDSDPLIPDVLRPRVKQMVLAAMKEARCQ